MDDLISRAAAIDAAIDGADDWDGGYNPERERYIREYMAKVPTVDAVPVKRGHWIFHRSGRAECAVCHHDFFVAYDMENADRYCRHCGADMGGAAGT